MTSRLEQARLRVRQRLQRAAWRALRPTIAATFAFTVAREMPAVGDAPIVAALSALLVVQVTLYGTLRNSLQRVASVVAGVLLAVAVAELGLHPWTLALLVGASLVVGYLLHLGPHREEVAITGMLILAVGGTDQAVAGRVVETLIGTLVGVGINTALGPPLHVQPAGVAVAELAGELRELLNRVADELVAGPSRAQAIGWTEEARRVDGRVTDVNRSLVDAEESLRFNPRRRRAAAATPGLRSGLDALEHAAVAVRGLCRSLADWVSRTPEDEPPYDESTLRAFNLLLRGLAEAVGEYGAIVRSELSARDPFSEERLDRALARARRGRSRLAELVTTHPGDDPAGWELHGALLANVDRVLHEITLEERARAQERLRAEAERRRQRARERARAVARTRPPLRHRRRQD